MNKHNYFTIMSTAELSTKKNILSEFLKKNNKYHKYLLSSKTEEYLNNYKDLYYCRKIKMNEKKNPF